MTEAMKLQIVSLQLKGIAQTWWDNQMENSACVMDIRDPVETQKPHITIWEEFFQALRDHFYPLGYRHNLLSKWLQLQQFTHQSVQSYIDVFFKLCIELHISNLEEVLIFKFNSGLLTIFHREFDLFESPSLDKAFFQALTMEPKVALKSSLPQPDMVLLLPVLCILSIP